MTKRSLREESKLIDFLWESNKIENVTDDDSFAQALKAWQYLNKYDKLSVEILNKTHAILMKNQPLDEEAKGHFRKCAVWIGGREGKPWYALPELMDDWVRRINHHIVNKSIFKNIEDIIKEDHVSVETAHPYQDGNGRIFRLILNWQRIKCGLPILVIHASERQKYYQWFKE